MAIFDLEDLVLAVVVECGSLDGWHQIGSVAIGVGTVECFGLAFMSDNQLSVRLHALG